MTATAAPQTAELSSAALLYRRWVHRACQAALDSFERERMAAATTIVRASRRTRLAGSGIGLDVARFGAAALREAGLEAFAQHAFDLAAHTSGYDPAESVIGVDTDAPDVRSALALARASGIPTIALSDRELTRIRADVLLPHPGFSLEGALDASPAAACIVLAHLSARIEPGSSLANGLARFPTLLELLTPAQATAGLFANELLRGERRLIIAASGPTRWVADSFARRINQMSAARPLPAALPLHIADVRAPEWKFRPDDALITLESPGRSGEPAADHEPSWTPALASWRIGGAPGGTAWHTRLPGESPALASLAALYLLEHLLLELAGA